jgi:WhiB family transcriptional regulator, redox-sensing transcriptional regulator
MDWRHRAACVDLDPELFFPVGEGAGAAVQLAEAKAVCAGCRVRSECLEWALSTRQTFGVWGGTSEAERRALRRERQATDRATRISELTAERLWEPGDTCNGKVKHRRTVENTAARMDGKPGLRCRDCERERQRAERKYRSEQQRQRRNKDKEMSAAS